MISALFLKCFHMSIGYLLCTANLDLFYCSDVHLTDICVLLHCTFSDHHQRMLNWLYSKSITCTVQFIQVIRRVTLGVDFLFTVIQLLFNISKTIHHVGWVTSHLGYNVYPIEKGLEADQQKEQICCHLNIYHKHHK